MSTTKSFAAKTVETKKLELDPHQEYLNASGQIWQDGWFLHERGQTSGPYLAKEIFLAPKLLQNDRQKVLSRKGFKRWYSFESLASIYQQNFTKNLPTPEKKVQVPLPIETKSINVKKPMQAALVSNKPANNKPASFEYQHMLLRGRLRLGSVTSPWLLAFVFLPMSLGLYWRVWYRRALSEVAFHVDNPRWMNQGGGCWSVFIPGWHVVKIYRLARLVQQMEAQNRYSSISPLVATFLSLLPPLTMIYVQKCLNKHWRLHVEHAALS